MRDWLLAADQNFGDIQKDWPRQVNIYSGENLFVACCTPRQWRFLPWMRSGTCSARFNNWLVETRRTMYIRGILSDFHNQKLILLTDSAARRAFLVLPIKTGCTGVSWITLWSELNLYRLDLEGGG